jgi:hypothetical protein
LLADVEQSTAGFAVAFGGECPQVVCDAEQKPQDFEVDVHRVKHRRSLAGVACADQAFQYDQRLPFDLFADRETAGRGGISRSSGSATRQIIAPRETPAVRPPCRRTSLKKSYRVQRGARWDTRK